MPAEHGLGAELTAVRAELAGLAGTKADAA